MSSVEPNLTRSAAPSQRGAGMGGVRCIQMVLAVCGVLAASERLTPAWAQTEAFLTVEQFSEQPRTLRAQPGKSGSFIWWLPEGGDKYMLPISAGVRVDTSRSDLMTWLREGSPWSFLELPALGVRYGDQQVVVIVPWPHYAELVVQERIGIRYVFPQSRHDAAPCEIVILRRETEPLAVAKAFREWRETAAEIGAIPRPRTLETKIAELPHVQRLLGAGHFYLWGPAVFCRHDVPRSQWVPFAKALLAASPPSFGGRLVEHLGADRSSLEELAAAEWPMNYLTIGVANGINGALSQRDLLSLDANLPLPMVIRSNQLALANAFPEYLAPVDSWGDGPSATLLDSMHVAGIDNALLLLSDLYAEFPRPDALAAAERHGYLLGPYDSYHSVHSPTAGPNDTWETAQFDSEAYKEGRVLNADGSGHGGFRGRGYHFSPAAAWPYVQDRVARVMESAPYSAWFVDCDATGECFDDYAPGHPATKADDTRLRRQRLSWLESRYGLVVGSEGGSALFADVIHFGHGVHTPYIGHLHPGFRDRESPYFLGRHWPSDEPEQSFKATPLPPAMRTPYFDPTVRVPLYQAAFGDELVTTHHWSMDSLKFEDVKQVRELMEILYLVPPMYHLNRNVWPKRQEVILRHLKFWGPLHRQLATAPLIRFEYLTANRLVQRTTFATKAGEAMITVNFATEALEDYPPLSATVRGAVSVSQHVYQAATGSFP